MTTHQAPFLTLVYSRPEPGATRRKSTAAKAMAGGRHDEPGDNPYFGHWIEDYLQEMYADILSEPIPQDIIDIINNKTKKP
ncbi:hypothetical protein [Oceanibaculum nanhaiense]|uniref:hypothetical protein n=1 Tax=Oceanibaculum nanhaiense TaxID=1909734 RepID=UPI003D2E957A